MPTEEYRKLVKKQSPNNSGGRSNYIYETKNLRGFLSLSELREALVALAQNHYLSYQYIMNNFGANDHDALQEVFNAESKGIFQKSNPNDVTAKLFWHLNPNLTEKDLHDYIYPKIANNQKPKVQKYSEAIRPVKHFSPKTHRKTYNPDPRGESNRIANEHERRRYDSIVGDVSPDRKPDADNYHWSDKTSRQFNRKLRSGEIRPDDG